MKNLIILLTFLIICYAQTPTNGTDSSQTECHLTNPTCDGNGICMNDGKCRCYNSYFGGSNTNSCDRHLVRHIQGYRTAAIVLCVWTAIFFFLATVVSGYRLLIEFVYASESDSQARLITKYVLSFIVFNSLALFVQSLDFWGNFGILPIKFYYILNYITHPLFVMIFCALFFHWVELYNKATKKLRKAEMLKKIRQDYDANVSMEEILINISSLSRYKFIYLAFGLASVAVFIGEIVIQITATSETSFLIMDRFYDTWFAILWIGFLIAFIWYGVHLIKIMPKTIAEKIKQTTILVGVFSVSALACNIIDISTDEFGSLSGVWVYYVSSFLDMVGIYSAIFIYIPIWQWKDWFNPRMIRSLITSSKTTNQSNQSNDSNNSDGKKAADAAV